MRSASRKPRVVTSSVGSPLRSSSALVATVVPIFTDSTCSGVIGSPAPRPSRRRMPATAASRYCSGLSESSFSVVSVPSGRLPTTSVKVPPRSIQNCQRRSGDGLMVCSVRPSPRRAAPRTRVVMSCTGRPVAARTASAYGGMLVHSRTIAATSGWRADQARAAATVARAASATSSSARSSRSGGAEARIEREPFERRVGARADRAQVLGGERGGIGGDDADPAAVVPRRPRARRRAAGSTSRPAPSTAAAISRWKSARKPQLVVDRGDAFAFERARRVDERREQRPVALDHDAARRRAAHDAVADRERRTSADCRCRPAAAESASRA